MIIGIDIDGTINDIHSAILEYGKIYNQSVINGIIKNEKAYRIKDIFNWDNKDCYKFKWIIQSDISTKIKSRDDVVEALLNLKEKGYKIYIITGRKKNEMIDRDKDTKQWLENNKIPYDKLIFEENNKGIACNKNNVNFFVDDSPKHLNKINKYGIKCYLFDNVYNKDDNNYERVYSFSELCDKILKEGERI